MKQLSCFKCDKKLKSAFRTNNAPPLDASVFWGGFTYGSQFDALASGKDLELNICDTCIKDGLKNKLIKKVPSKHK